MKHITVFGIIALVGAVFVTTNAVAAMKVGPGINQTGSLWGFVGGPMDTPVYRLKDSDNGATCYFAYFGKGGMEMDCVE